MKDLTKITLYFVATIVVGALLAPLLFWSGQWAAARGYLPFLGEVPFQKFWNRAMLVSALLLLWPTVRLLQVKDLKTLGFRVGPRPALRVLVGFLASFGLILLLAVLLLHLGVYRLKDVVPWTALAKITVSAVTVSVIEECLFRGAILGLLRRTLSVRAAIIASAALFAIVHFLKPDERHELAGTAVTWMSGFQLIPLAFWQFAEPQLVLAGFSTLFCIGCVLGYATVRTGSLWMAIGLHAGWIFGKFGFSKLTKRLLRDTFPWFGPDLSIGLGSVIAVLLTGFLVWWWINYVDVPAPQTSR